MATVQHHYSAAAASAPPDELIHERVLAEKTALVRLALTLANFLIIWLDQSVPEAGTPGAYAEAVAAALAFTLYALSAWVAVRRGWLSLGRYFAATPIADVAAAAVLILATDGYLSPFHLWFALAVVNAGLGRSPKLPLLTAALALAAHGLIAAVPQAQPLDVTVFAVRSGYLFGVAAVLSSISFHLASESRALAVLAQHGRDLGEVVTREAAARALLARLTQVLRVRGARLTFADDSLAQAGVTKAGRAAARCELRIGARRLGQLELFRAAPLTAQEEAIARLLCDRTASALVRIQLSQQLVAAARVEERLRISDELHDTYLQTLAALDLRAEAALRLSNGSDAELAAELQAIKQVGRRAASQLRDALGLRSGNPVVGPESLRKVVVERWPGAAHIEVAPDVTLSADEWQAVEMLVKEGVNNARRHGQAERIDLRLSRGPDGRRRCALWNDGQPADPAARFGYGLTRLREVIAAHAGTLELRRPEAGGAELVAEFPPA